MGNKDRKTEAKEALRVSCLRSVGKVIWKLLWVEQAGNTAGLDPSPWVLVARGTIGIWHFPWAHLPHLEWITEVWILSKTRGKAKRCAWRRHYPALVLFTCAGWGTATTRTAAGAWSVQALLWLSVCRSMWCINSEIKGDHNMHIVHIWNCIFRWFVFCWAIQLTSAQELIYDVYLKWWVRGRRWSVVKYLPLALAGRHAILLALCLHQVFYNRQTSVLSHSSQRPFPLPLGWAG